MKILLTGKNGQVGFELQRVLAPLAEIVAVNSRACNLADGAALRDLIWQLKPDEVVNPAAYGHILKPKSADIHPITSADYHTPARRPANSRLDCTKFKKTFGLVLPPWQQGLDHILQQIIPARQP
jgi:dTDP-4-dehydrorhamnose reductase